MSDVHLRDKVAEHDRDLAIIRRDFAVVQATVEQSTARMSSLSDKIDKLTDTLSKSASTSMSDIKDGLQVVVLAAAIIGGAVSSIVYVAGNANSVDIAVLRQKVDRVENGFNWHVTTRPEK